MANLGFLFSVRLFEATSSIETMKMLADQARRNIELALREAREPGAIREMEIEGIRTGNDGEPTPYPVTYYAYGPCYQDNEYEVLLEYDNLITQLTRRSALLTIYGLFEHGINGSLELMRHISGYNAHIKDGVTGQTHKVLTEVIGGNVRDVSHINKIRNIMAHNDGILRGNDKKAVKRAEDEGADIQVIFGKVHLGDDFLDYVVEELSRYLKEMVEAIQIYHKNKGQASPTPMVVISGP